MDAGNLELAFMFLAQTGVGILGNSSLLCFYSFSLLTGNKVRPTDLILSQLVIANSLVLFFKGIPQTIVAFGWKYFLGDAGCKLVFCFHRVSTGVSFSTLCLLNGFQAIKLNPHLCRWITLKIQSPKFISSCCFLCWILHLLINSFLPIIVNGPLNNKNLSADENRGYCSWTMHGSYSPLYAVLNFSPDLISLVLMAWASGSMVLVLHRHKQRVKHIHSGLLGPRPSYEARVTSTILILVSSYISFYSVYTILTMWMTLAANQGQWVVNSSVLVASCFPALSPFVLIISDTRISQFSCYCRVRTNCFLYSG